MYSGRVQQLVHRGWHRVSRKEELLTQGGRGGGRWQSRRLVRTGDGGRAAGSLAHDADGTGSRSLLEADAHSYLGKSATWRLIWRGLMTLIHLPVLTHSRTVIWLDRKWKVEIKEKIRVKIGSQWLGKWKPLSRFRLFTTPGTIQSHGILQNTGEGRCSLLQGIFPTQGLNPDVPHCRQILNQLSHHVLTLSFLAAKVKQETP